MGAGFSGNMITVSRQFPDRERGAGRRTVLVALEDAAQADEVDAHAQLGVGLDVERLVAEEARAERGARVLAARDGIVCDFEELGREGRGREGVGVADARDVVLVVAFMGHGCGWRLDEDGKERGGGWRRGGGWIKCGSDQRFDNTKNL
jgi:hypothetical protein